MREDRSGLYRRRDGEERIWLSPSKIESMTEEVLRTSEVFPTDEQPAVDIERLIQRLHVRMDQHADLEPTVLGLTEFYTNEPPKIFINSDLTGAIDDDHTPPGIRGRWRATIAHEASHVVMHRVLFEVNQEQDSLFQMQNQPEPQRLMRCLKKNVLYRGGGTNDWREVQANMGMAALLMPQSLFRQLADSVAERHRMAAESLTIGSRSAATLAAEMAACFDVSRQAAGIRLETLGILSPAGQSSLIHKTR
jgi:hypothetical protein